VSSLTHFVVAASYGRLNYVLVFVLFLLASRCGMIADLSMRHMSSYQCGVIAVLLVFGVIADYGLIAVLRCGIIADL
jgi:hypothetical protein